MLAALAALGVSGCQPVQAGAAATVGDERISTSALENTVEAVLAAQQRTQAGAPDEGQLQRSTLSRMIVGIIIGEAASREGVTVTRGEVDARIDQVRQQVGGTQQLRQALLQDGIRPADLPSLVEQSLAAEKIGEKLVPGAGQQVQIERQTRVSQLLQQVSAGLDIEVSPRYGRWSAQQASVVPDFDELSQPPSAFAEQRGGGAPQQGGQAPQGG